MARRKEQKEALRRERVRREEEERQAAARARRLHRLALAGIAVVAGVLITLSVVLGGKDATKVVDHDQIDHSGQMRNPPVRGATAPAFRAMDVSSGRYMTQTDLRGRRSLLFFSEGVSCQACMVQAADLQKSKALRKRGIALVSVTTDSPGILRQAAKEYGIKTPLLADQSRKMMGDWGQLGNGGMGHPDTGGHSFVLVDPKGKVLWEGSYGEMYVPTGKLLEDMHA